MNSADSPVDLVIIGGGPTGLFAAFYAGMRRMSATIVDSLDTLGGQLVTLYPEKYIYDVAGFPKVLAKDLAQNLIEQGLQFGARVCLGEQVMSLAEDVTHCLFHVVTDKQEHVCRAVLIAGGVGAFEPKRLPLANASEYEDRGLYYFVKKLDEFADKRILIVGGGDSAIDWANTLSAKARSLTLIHRRDVFRAHEDSIAKMMMTPTKVLVFHELKALGGQEHIEWATVFDNRTQAQQTLEVDTLLVNIGFNNALGPIKNWGLELAGGQIKVDTMMRTNRPGIFAAGDIASFPGKLKLIATGFGEAATAVNVAKQFIDPSANLFPGHSTNLKR